MYSQSANIIEVSIVRKGLVGSALGGVAMGIMVALVLLYIMVPAGQHVSGVHPQMNVILTVNVYDENGQLKKHIVKTGDLLLRNWVALQQYWFMVSAAGTTGVGVVDNTGVPRAGASCWSSSGQTGYTAKIILSNDTTASINDTNMYALASFGISSMQILFSGNNMNLTFTGSYTTASAMNVTSVGVEITAYFDAATPYNVLVFKDVLPSPVVLNVGDTIAVTYTIMYTNP